MKRPRYKDLRAWRPFLQGEDMRTFWNKDLRSWVTERRSQGEIIFSEKLSLPRFSRPIRVALLELESVNTFSPEVSREGVFLDLFGHWAVQIPCSDCQGFPWRLPLRREARSGKRKKLEVEMARLLAYRAQSYFQNRDDCPGCFERRVLADDPQLRERSFYWYSPRYQDWIFRHAREEEYTDYPLDLPSWANESDLRDRIAKIVPGRGVFDWENE